MKNKKEVLKKNRIEKIKSIARQMFRLETGRDYYYNYHPRDDERWVDCCLKSLEIGFDLGAWMYGGYNSNDLTDAQVHKMMYADYFKLLYGMWKGLETAKEFKRIAIKKNYKSSRLELELDE